MGLDTSLLEERIPNPVPTSPSQRAILENELADVRQKYTAETDPDMKQQHARNIIAITRDLARKRTEFPFSEDLNPDYVAQVEAMDRGEPAPFKVSGIDTRLLEAETPLTVPGERAETPAGAVTGQFRPPFPRFDIRGPGSADTRKALRAIVETGSASAGSLVGAYYGTILGGPAGTTPGRLAGETGATYLSSLLSETFDPQEEPFREAAKSAGIMLGTGLFAVGGAGIARRLVGKPHEAGQALIDIMAAKGEVPLPGTVLDSKFMKDAQSYGSAAFGTSQWLAKAHEGMEATASASTREYISGFQRYWDSSKNLFREIDQTLLNPKVPGQMGVHAQSGKTTVTGPGVPFMLKGDEKIRDALKDMMDGQVRVAGRVDALPTGLQKMYRWGRGELDAPPRFTFEETQQIASALQDKSRHLEYAMRNQDTAELVPATTAKYIREQAQRAKNALDEQIDAAIANKAIDPDTKAKLLAARANWNQWVQGQHMERMLADATKDIKGPGGGNISGTKLLNEIDAQARLDREIGGKPALDPRQYEAVRRYAIALRAIEESGKAAGFALAGRRGQLIGISAAGATAGGLVAGVPGAVTGGTVAATAGFLAPHAITWIFTSPKAQALLLRGLRMEPGSAAAVRAMRELSTLGIKEGRMGRGWLNNSDDAEPNVTGTIPGVRGNVVPNPSVAPLPTSIGVRG